MRSCNCFYWGDHGAICLSFWLQEPVKETHVYVREVFFVRRRLILWINGNHSEVPGYVHNGAKKKEKKFRKAIWNFLYHSGFFNFFSGVGYYLLRLEFCKVEQS